MSFQFLSVKRKLKRFLYPPARATQRSQTNKDKNIGIEVHLRYVSFISAYLGIYIYIYVG